MVARAFLPENNLQLQQMVNTVLSDLSDAAVTVTETGSSVEVNSVQVSSRVFGDVPAVLLFAPMVAHVSDTPGTGAELCALNRRHPLVKFDLAGHVVSAMVSFPARPFAPDHVRESLQVLLAAVMQESRTLAERLGGTVCQVQPAAPVLHDKPQRHRRRMALASV